MIARTASTPAALRAGTARVGHLFGGRGAGCHRVGDGLIRDTHAQAHIHQRSPVGATSSTRIIRRYLPTKTGGYAPMPAFVSNSAASPE
jgi:hypothetical protein